MKKVLLITYLLLISGCMNGMFETSEEIALRRSRQNSLINGKVYIGMTQRDFAKIWPVPYKHLIKRSASSIGISEWWSYDWYCYPTYMSIDSQYHFSFDNYILTFWTEY